MESKGKLVIPPIPPIKLRDLVVRSKGGVPETQALVFSDWHIGEETESYNIRVAENRIEYLFDTAVRIASLHRNAYPVDDLVIFLVGDMVHGENVHQGATMENTASSVFKQIFEYALPMLTNGILSIKPYYRTITLECVDGNHGRYSIEAPKSSNWDRILYAALQARLSKQKGIKVNYSNEFYKIVEIQGKRFFLFHGHQVRTYQGIPMYGLKRKVASWATTFGGFEYAVCGHWHESNSMNITSKTELIMNGSLVTDDPYALEVVGTSSEPRQWTFGVHPKHGITWRYALESEH